MLFPQMKTSGVKILLCLRGFFELSAETPQVSATKNKTVPMFSDLDTSSHAHTVGSLTPGFLSGEHRRIQPMFSPVFSGHFVFYLRAADLVMTLHFPAIT